MPYLRKKFLSSGKIEQNGLTIVLKNGKAEIHNKNGQIAVGSRNSTLCEIIFKVIKSNALLSEQKSDINDLWHY